MNTRFVTVAVALLLAGGVILVGQRLGKHTPTASPGRSPNVLTSPTFSTGSNCLKLPKRAAAPSWFPADLPLPVGSYPNEEFRVPNQKRAAFAVKGSLTDFVKFVLAKWPANGWVLGRGDAEPGEADDSFRDREGKRVGAFKARSIYCDQGWTFVLFVLADIKPTPTPTPTSTSS